jgi:carbon-monoxide dehydrogenase medium subunit
MVRRTSDFAIVAVAALVELDERADTIAAARVALAGVADRVVLADPELLTGLTGSALTGGGDDAAGDVAARVAGSVDPAGDVAARVAGSVDPADDVHASGEYRRRLVRVLTARALREAYARAAGAPL